MIGKSVNDVVNTYGKPVHQDLSNPDMKCVFYQTKRSRAAFIADKTGVYQIQVDLSFNTEKDAIRSIDDFLLDCGSESYQIDTLGVGNYDIRSSGVKMNLSLFENKYAKKYEVKFSANRSESK
ncbi:MAG: hypothetical protein FJ214_05305 [Ignavibacteria bacterium]|nr:hypothetical protein [Ignavibacteria bacterium]